MFLYVYSTTSCTVYCFLYCLLYYIARSIDNNQISALVLLDMSAAFDTVDHAILMSVLEKRLGVQREALQRLQWFTSYSSNRTKPVYVGADHTSPSTLHCGVPQGSVIGPAIY